MKWVQKRGGERGSRHIFIMVSARYRKAEKWFDNRTICSQMIKISRFLFMVSVHKKCFYRNSEKMCAIETL